MCTNQRTVINPYTGQRLYVKCGKCPACLQEKAAHRVSRIKLQDSDDTDVFMLSLTYRRFDCPYVLRSEAYEFCDGSRKTLNVYRDTSYRKVRFGSDYKLKYKKTIGRRVIQTLDFVQESSLYRTKDLQHEHDKIGVCYYPDLQNFFARLRLNLKRKYNYDKDFKAYCCSEYGSKSHRPHMHCLLWISKGDSETFRSAIIESWPFSDLSRFPRAFEKAFRASSYVASYVNSGSKFPQFLKTYFKTKHSYSKGFGCSNKLFQPDKILDKFYRGHLTYFVQKDIEGIPTICELPIPKYIIHRYFPLFKGYHRFTGASQCDHMSGFNCLEYDEFISRFGFYTPAEKLAIGVRLSNSMSRLREALHDDLSFDEYYRLHQSVWNMYKSDVLRLSMQDDKISLNEKYDNLSFVKEMVEDYNKPLPVGFTHNMLRVTDPNLFGHTIARTMRMEQSFHENIKHRRVTNTVVSSINEEW